VKDLEAISFVYYASLDSSVPNRHFRMTTVSRTVKS